MSFCNVTGIIHRIKRWLNYKIVCLPVSGPLLFQELAIIHIAFRQFSNVMWWVICLFLASWPSLNKEVGDDRTHLMRRIRAMVKCPATSESFIAIGNTLQTMNGFEMDFEVLKKPSIIRVLIAIACLVSIMWCPGPRRLTGPEGSADLASPSNWKDPLASWDPQSYSTVHDGQSCVTSGWYFRQRSILSTSVCLGRSQ